MFVVVFFVSVGEDRVKLCALHFVPLPHDLTTCLKFPQLALPTRRPADVKKLVVKPTGVRKDAAPTATAVVPTEVTADE